MINLNSEKNFDLELKAFFENKTDIKCLKCVKTTIKQKSIKKFVNLPEYLMINFKEPSLSTKI